MVWATLGDVSHYIEPFFGTGSVLFMRPHSPHIETINDADGFVTNFWRAVKHDPEAVARYADNPVNECDLTARHSWLITQRDSLVEKLCTDHEFFDPKIAGYWVWGINCWIGVGWTTKRCKSLPYLISIGQGIHREEILHSSDIQKATIEYLLGLQKRLRNVRICSGDWSRICTPAVVWKQGMLTGVFLDPPYSADGGQYSKMYAVGDEAVAKDVCKWAIENGEKKKVRIVVAGYDGEHIFPSTWRVVKWKASGGYANTSLNGQGRENAERERLWLSPNCEDPEESLFSSEDQ